MKRENITESLYADMEAIQNYTGNSGSFLRLQTPVTLLQPKGYPTVVSL